MTMCRDRARSPTGPTGLLQLKLGALGKLLLELHLVDAPVEKGTPTSTQGCKKRPHLLCCGGKSARPGQEMRSRVRGRKDIQKLGQPSVCVAARATFVAIAWCS